MSQEKILFANQLRGLAAFAVLLTHLALGLNWFTEIPLDCTRQLSIAHTPPLETASLVRDHLPIALSHFGVATFFLISGFVIPFSLLSQNRAAFVVSRFCRIAPTYWVALGVGLLFLWAAHRIEGAPFQIGWRNPFAHALFLRDFRWWPMLDGVVWTLEIEVKFYLLCLVIKPLLRDADIIGILGLVSLSCFMVYWTTDSQGMPLSQPGIWAAGFTMTMMSFMLIGVVLHFHHVGKIGVFTWLLTTIFLFGAFAFQFRYSIAQSAARAFIIDYGKALGIFTVCYFLRHRFRPNRLLDGLAEISYSMYAIHALSGYCVFFLVLKLTGSRLFASGSTILVAIGLTYLLWRSVERPSQRLGRKLARRLCDPQSSPNSTTHNTADATASR